VIIAVLWTTDCSAENSSRCCSDVKG